MPSPAQEEPKESYTVTEGPRAVWERRDDLGENQVQYGHFVVYRNMGRDRTVTAAAQAEELQPQSLWELSGKFKWRERAAAWDNWNESLWLAKVADLRHSAAQQHYDVASKGIRLVADRLQAVIDSGGIQRMSWGDAAKFMEVCSMMQRRALGLESPANRGGSIMQFNAPVQINDQRQVNINEEVEGFLDNLIQFARERAAYEDDGVIDLTHLLGGGDENGEV